MQKPLQISLVKDDRDQPRMELVRLPSFADRQDIVAAYTEAKTREGLALARVYAAAVGLTTRLGRESGTTFDAHNCNVFAYGGAMWNHLNERGADMLDIAREGQRIIDAIFEALAPRASEVAAAEGFTGRSAVPST